MTNQVALAEAASGQDPAAGLRAARALRELAERLEALQVQNAREHGWSWQEIAVFLGVSKQAVHKKYSGLLATIGPGGMHRGRRRAAPGFGRPSARADTAGGSGGSSLQANTAGDSGGSSPQANTAGGSGGSSPQANTAGGSGGPSPRSDAARGSGGSSRRADTTGAPDVPPDPHTGDEDV